MLTAQLHQYLSSVPVNSLKATFVAVSALALTACGSGSGDTQQGSDGSDSSDTSTISPVTILATETKPLDHLSDIDLQRSASTGSKQMQSGMNNAQGFVTQPAFSDSINSANMGDLQQILGLSDDDASGTATQGDVVVSDDSRVDYSDSLWDDTGVEELIDITLGLVGNADVTRDGNTMIIDPDDNELCEHGAVDSDMNSAFDMQQDMNDMEFCLAMVSDVLVRIDGQTEDSGNISYLFQDETVLQIEYATNQTLFKLRLPGIRRVLDKANTLDSNQFDSVPDVLEGVIEWGLRIDNETVGSEAGVMTIAIAAPIVVQDSMAGFNMQVAATDLLSFEHNNALGTASVELDSRAFLLSLTDGQAFEVAASGGTVKIDLINDGEQISVSKLGLGNGPLTVTIDSVEVINMTLDTFGFDIDTLAEQLVLTQSMNLNLMVNLVGALLDGSDDEALTMQASVSAPQNALFSAQPNGSVRLDNAGPFSIDWSFNFAGESESSNFAVSPGECFTEDDSGNALFSQVVCQ